MQKEEWGYLTVWEFQVRAGQEARFEKVYGSDGAWAQLFRHGEGYLGSELVRDLKQPNRYLTLDFWASRSAYESFHEKHSADYHTIDEQCEQLAEWEAQVGEFEPTVDSG